MKQKKIPIYKPNIGLIEAIVAFNRVIRNQISGKPEIVRESEIEISNALGVENFLFVSNGTTALEVALRSLELKNGSKIMIPEIGYIAVANTVISLGFKPIVCKVDSHTLQIDLQEAEQLIKHENISAIIVIHNYGFVCDLGKLLSICNDSNIFLIEDCAEAIGSKFDNVPVGQFGHASTFSFFANKLITAGEGGGVAFKLESHLKRARLLINQNINNKQNLTTFDLGFNYRMSGILVGILISQTRSIDKLLSKKYKIFCAYKKFLSNQQIEFQIAPKGSTLVPWLVNIKFSSEKNRINCEQILANHKIETRRIFPPLSNEFYGPHISLSPSQEALEMYNTWLSLPSFPSLKKREIKYICNLIKLAEMAD
jgi:perosamine synthetase